MFPFSHRDLPGAAQSASLAAAVPSPETIVSSQDESVRHLVAQLQHGMESLQAEHIAQMDAVRHNANQQISGFTASVEDQVKRAELVLNQKFNENMMILKQRADVQRADIERQGAGLMLQYTQRKAQDEYVAQTQVIGAQLGEMQMKLQADMQARVQAQASLYAPPGAPAQASLYAPPGAPLSAPGTPQTSFVPPIYGGVMPMPYSGGAMPVPYRGMPMVPGGFPMM